MRTEEKEARLRKTLKIMTENELKKICFDSFIDGIEKGMKIKEINNSSENEVA